MEPANRQNRQKWYHVVYSFEAKAGQDFSSQTTITLSLVINGQLPNQSADSYDYGLNRGPDYRMHLVTHCSEWHASQCVWQVFTFHDMSLPLHLESDLGIEMFAVKPPSFHSNSTPFLPPSLPPPWERTRAIKTRKYNFVSLSPLYCERAFCQFPGARANSANRAAYSL